MAALQGVCWLLLAVAGVNSMQRAAQGLQLPRAASGRSVRGPGALRP